MPWDVWSIFYFNPLYNGGLSHCFMLGEFICHFRGVGSYFVAFIKFLMENPVSKQRDFDQTPHYMASDHCLHCFPLTLLWVSR